MNNNFLDLKKTNIMAELLIYGDDFEIGYITNELNITPTNFHKKGDKIRKTDRKHELTCWSWSTGYNESLSVNDQMSKVIDTFINKKDNLINLKSQFNLEYKIDVVINIENGEAPSIYLTYDTIQFLDAIKSEFDCDLYIYS